MVVLLLARATAGGEAATRTAVPSDSRRAVGELMTALREGVDWNALGKAPFAQVSLTQADEATARAELWKAWAAVLARDRAQEMRDKVIRIGSHELRFEVVNCSEKTGPRGLFISMHGGGGGPKEVNDQQWRNQIRLYQPKGALYIAPRAPTDTWNMWHQAHVDDLFARLIEDAIVLENVDPNRVYLIGYSAGGDGAYQLASRMAYRWAAVGAMAGHPNDTSPLCLRNIGFALYAGANDSAYKRNEVALEWKRKLEDLAREDPKGYAHDVQVVAGCGHWMNGKEAAAIPGMQRYARNPVPDRVVWVQDDVTHEGFYWLRVQGSDRRARAKIVASYAGQTVTLESSDVRTVTVLLSDRMLDLDRRVTVRWGELTVFEDIPPRTIRNCVACLRATNDPELLFGAAVTVSLP
jgi:predicted esterase